MSGHEERLNDAADHTSVALTTVHVVDLRDILRDLEDARFDANRYALQWKQEVARNAYMMDMLTRIYAFVGPEDIRLPDGRVFYYNGPDIPVMFRGLCDAIRAAAMPRKSDGEMMGTTEQP